MSQATGDLNAAFGNAWRVVVRKRWWIMLTTCAVTLAVVGMSFRIPNLYRSEATLLIAKPSVTQQYVVLNSSANAMEAVDAIKRQVLSRARLQKIIETYGLYAKQRPLGWAAVTDQMRNDIELQPVSKDPERRPMNAFLVAYTGNDAYTAQQVTSRLADLFIEENSELQRQLSTATTNFLHQQVLAAKAELDRQEAIMRDYRLSNLGELPEQSGENVAVLNGLQLQLQATEANLTRARQERTYLQAMLSHYAPGRSKAGDGPSSSLLEMQQNLAKLREQRDDLLSRYSELYPDVIALNQRISEGEAQIQKLLAVRADSDPRPAPERSMGQVLDPAALQLRSQLEANTVEIADAERQVRQLGAQSAAYRKRLSLAPLRQQQFEQIQRGYETAKENYANLLGKETQSALATDLEAQQRPEQFQIIDPASLPLRPISPHRQRIGMFGLLGGLVAGLVLAFAAEMRDRSFHSEQDVRRTLPVLVVIGIPALRTVAERQRLRRRVKLEWALAGLLAAATMVAEVSVYWKG